MKIKNLKSHSYNSVVFREVEGEEFEAFKESIKENGLQVQIEITSDNIILCGHQRIKALRELYGDDYELDDSKIWIRKDLESDDKEMTDILQRKRVIEDNQLRRHLNEGEKTMIYKEKKVLEKLLAKIRQGTRTDIKENLPESKKGQSRDKASEGLNLSGKTLENYEKMYDLADDKEKEHFLKTGKIPKSLKEKYQKEKQRLAKIKSKEANELRKKKLLEAKEKARKEKIKRQKEEEKKRKAEAKRKKKELEEKIKIEKLEKEEAERLLREEKEIQEEEERLRLEEEERLRLEEEEKKKNSIVYYKSSEKMDDVLDETIGLVVTSPPYWKIKEYGGGESKWSYSDYLKSMKKVWKECFRVLKTGSKLCINIGDQFMSAKENEKFEVIPIHADFIKQCKELGFDYHGSIIWQKVSTMNSSGGGTFLGSYPYPKKGILLFDYEYILVFYKPGEKQKVSDDIKQSSLISEEEWKTYFTSHWNFVGEKQKDHPAIFPEELPKRLIKMFSFKEETILDPFLGSGTTLKVAKELERKGIGYELNEEDFKSLIEMKLYGGENGSK